MTNLMPRAARFAVALLFIAPVMMAGSGRASANRGRSGDERPTGGKMERWEQSLVREQCEQRKQRCDLAPSHLAPVPKRFVQAG